LWAIFKAHGHVGLCQGEPKVDKGAKGSKGAKQEPMGEKGSKGGGDGVALPPLRLALGGLPPLYTWTPPV
jgi:hypothetical protein